MENAPWVTLVGGRHALSHPSNLLVALSFRDWFYGARFSCHTLGTHSQKWTTITVLEPEEKLQNVTKDCRAASLHHFRPKSGNLFSLTLTHFVPTVR